MTSVRTMKRKPRRANGAKELAWGKVVETGHDAGGDGPLRHGGGMIPKLELGVTRVKAGWDRLERGREGGDASTRNW